MPNFLIDGVETIAIFKSVKYPGCWILGASNFLVLNQAVSRSKEENGRVFYILAGKEKGIADAYKKYQENRLELFRGIASCHFSWSGLKDGLLASEGYADIPTFTMGNSESNKTRWLPTAQLDQEAASICLQDLDPFTKALSMSEPVFIGISVCIKISPELNVVCWYNSGELGVRGPLSQSEYGIATMAWLDALQVVFQPWPIDVAKTSLPEQRPYKPAIELDINRWWAKSQSWADRIASRDPEIKRRRDKSLLLVDIYD